MAEIGTVKPEQEEDDYAGYYKFNDVQPIHIQDDSYSGMSMPDRQKLWDAGFRPDDAAWELNSRHPSDIETNFVMFGRTHSVRYGGTLKPLSKYTKEDRLREMDAREFNAGGRAAPLPWHNKNFNSAQKLMGAIEYYQENMTREDRFSAAELAGGMVKRMPFTFGIPDMMEAGQQAAALDRIYEGNATTTDYSSVARSIVMAEKAEEDDFVVKAFRGASALPAYAADIALTGGVSALPKALGKKGANILLKKLGKEKFKKLMRNAVAKQVRKAAPYVIEGATHAGVTRVGETVAEAIPRRDLLFPDPDDPDAPITEEGFVKTEKDSLVNSTMRAFAQQAGGYIVEKLGGKVLEKVGKGVKGKTLDPVLDKLRSKIGKPAQKEVMEKGEAFLEKTIKEAWAKDNPMLAQLGEKLGLSGMVSELGEERMQELFNGANEYMFSLLPGYARDADTAVREKLGMFGGEMSRDQILEQLAIEAIGIGALKAGVSSFQADAQTDALLDGMERAKSDPIYRMLIDKGYSEQVQQLITEGSTSRKAFTQVKLPDGRSLYDVYNSEQKREEFLRKAEQMQIEVDRLEREESEQAEQPVPTQPEAEQPVPTQPEAEQPTQPEAEQPVPVKPEPQEQPEAEAEKPYDHAEAEYEAALKGKVQAAERGLKLYQDTYDKELSKGKTKRQLSYQKRLINQAAEELELAKSELSEYEAGKTKPTQPEAEQPTPTQPATKQPWQQSTEEFIEQYGDVRETEQRDTTKLGEGQADEFGDGVEGDTTDVTPSRGFSLPDNTENVSMQTSSKGKPYVLKRDRENNLYAVVDNKVVAYAANTAQGVDLDVVDEFKGQGIETKLADQFYELNPEAPVQGITSRSADRLTDDHFEAVKTALKKGEPVPFKVQEIHEAQAKLRAAEENFAQAEKPTPQQKGAVTRARNELDLVKAKYVEDVKPEETQQPVTPIEPETPVEPVIPIEPETPAEPVKPIVPPTPIQPEPTVVPPTEPEAPPIPPIPTRPETSPETKQKIKDVGRLSRVNVMKAYPGLRVTEIEDGNFQLHLPNAGVVNVLFHKDPSKVFLFTDKQLRQVYKDYAGKPGFYDRYPTPESYIKANRDMEARGASGVSGAFRPPKPSEAQLDVIGVIDMNDSAEWHARKNTDQLKTFKHELVHFAHFSGMWKPDELGALIDKYSDRGKTVRQQSEDLARAGALWDDPSLVKRIVDWINKYLSKLTNGKVQLTPEAARHVMMSPEFWERQTTRDVAKTTSSKYQPPAETPLLQTDADDIKQPGGKKRKPLYDRQDGGHANPGQTKEQRVAATIARQQKRASADPPIPDQDVRNKVNALRGKTQEERKKSDKEAIERWRDPKQAFNVFDQHWLITVANELIDTGDINDHAVAMELYSINVERGADAARVMRFRQDKMQGPIRQKRDSLWEAIFVPDPRVRQRLRHIKSKDPRKKAAALRAFEQEAKRLTKVRKYAVKLGYSLGKAGLMKLARNPKDALKVAHYAIKSKKSKGRIAADIFNEFTIGNMLSGIGTQVTNLKSNIEWGAWMEFESINAAILNSLTGNKEDIQLRDYYKALERTGMKKIIPQVATIFNTSVKNAMIRWMHERAVLEEQIGTEEHTKFEVAPSIPGLGGKLYRGLATGPMAAADQFFKTFFTHLDVGVHAAFLARQEADRRAKSPHVDNMTEEEINELTEELLLDKKSPAWFAAYQEATQKVFQDEGGELSQKSIKVLEGARRLPFGIGEGVKHLIVPWLKTPVRIAGNFAIRMPALSWTVLTPKMWNNYKDGNHIFKGISKELVGNFYASMLGFMLWGLLPDEDEEVWITGAKGSVGDPDLRRWQYTEGVPGRQEINIKKALPEGVSNFLNLGDVWISYSAEDPAAFFLATWVDMLHTAKHSEKEGLAYFGDVAKETGLSVAVQAQDKTFFKTIGELSKLITQDEGWERWAASLTSRVIPNLYSQTVRKNRDFVGDVGRGGVGDRFQKIVGFKDMKPIRDHWGRPAKSAGWSPVRYKSGVPFKGDKVYMAWNAMNPEKPKSPVSASREFDDEGVKRKFTEAEFDQYQQLSGELAFEVIDLMLPEDLAGKSSLAMIELVNDIISKSKTTVKDYYKDAVTKPSEGFEGFEDRRDLYMAKLKKAVFSKMGNFRNEPPPLRMGEPKTVYEDKLELHKEKLATAKKWYEWAEKNRDKIFND